MSTTKPTDLMRLDLALKELDIQPSTFYVACKRHDYLKEAIVTEIHPDTGKKWTRISRAAIDKYAAERKAGGGNHGGARKVTTWLMDDEIEQAEEILSEALGREITIERLYQTTKAEANGKVEAV
jgi:hypothetical protein